MPAIVWCDRASYAVMQSATEIETLIKDCKADYDFIWLDRATGQGPAKVWKPTGQQCMCRIGAISSVIPNGYDPREARFS